MARMQQILLCRPSPMVRCFAPRLFQIHAFERNAGKCPSLLVLEMRYLNLLLTIVSTVNCLVENIMVYL